MEHRWRGGRFLPPGPEVWVLFGATGSIAYLGMLFSRFTVENFLDKQRPKNVFDVLFLRTVAMAVLVYAIAIPFFQADYTSLPLTVGVLSGLMWLPYSWIIGHWVGTFHALARTALVTVGWYLFPTLRFVVVPAVIVMIYAVTIVVLEARWRRMRHADPSLQQNSHTNDAALGLQMRGHGAVIATSEHYRQKIEAQGTGER